MKNLTAIILAIAMLCAVSCKVNTTTPEETTTTVGSDAPIAPSETTETAPTEFDINSEECLMYRLLDMTYEEIEAEFGEMTLQDAPHHGYWYPEYRLSLNGEECYEITYHYEDADDKGIPYDNALPINVFVLSNSVEVFPGIKEDQKPDEVSCAVSKWDEVKIYPDGFDTVTTVLYVGDCELRVMWDTPVEMRDRIRNNFEGKTDEEKETICQSYADEFLKDFKTIDTKVKNIYVRKR